MVDPLLLVVVISQRSQQADFSTVAFVAKSMDTKRVKQMVLVTVKTISMVTTLMVLVSSMEVQECTFGPLLSHIVKVPPSVHAILVLVYHRLLAVTISVTPAILVPGLPLSQHII